jgi:hypothetical protein
LPLTDPQFAGKLGLDNFKTSGELSAGSTLHPSAALCARPDASLVLDLQAFFQLGAEKEAKAVNSDLDQDIEKNLDAALIQNKLHESVKYEVNNRVVTLTGARVLLAPGF